MRVAVCLSGEMRGFAGQQGLADFVIAPFKNQGHVVDLFIHTRGDKFMGEPSPDLGVPRVFCVEDNRPIDTSMIISPMNPKERGDYEGTDLRSHLYQSYLQQYWSMARVGKLLIQTEQREGRYDLVVRTRPDCWLTEPLQPDTLFDGKVHVPHNDWWPYEVDGKRVETVCDKFAVGHSVEMQLYLNKFKDMRTFCEQYRIQGEAFTAWELAGQRWIPDGKPTPWVRDSNIEINQDPKAHEKSERP